MGFTSYYTYLNQSAETADSILSLWNEISYFKCSIEVRAHFFSLRFRAHFFSIVLGLNFDFEGSILFITAGK